MSLKSKSGKARAYLSVTPGIGLELIQLDLNSNTVANYAVRELAYNESSREIVDYDKFKEAVASMYEELGINPKIEVVINMPLVSFGTMQLGLLLPDDAITGAIQGEIEQTYIFRRSEPTLDWVDVPNAASNTPGKETRQVLYSAIQKAVIDKLSEKLMELGSVLVGVENSLSSTFRALEYMGVTAAQMEPNTTWNLLVVNSVGYSITSLSGKNVIEYYEEPLPIKSFEEDEIYDAIAQSAQIALSSYPANYLYVISDTDSVSAEALISRLNVMGTIDFLENNAFKTQESLIPVSLEVLQSYASKISLQAIGCALSDVSDFPLKFNYMHSTSRKSMEPSITFPIGEHEIVVTKNGALYAALGLVAVLAIIFGLLGYVIIPSATKDMQGKVDKITDELNAVNAELETMQGKGDVANFDLKREVEMGVKNNRSKLMNYVAAGESIPQDVWLTYFMTQGPGYVDIQGGANDVSSVYVFFKNMRDSLIGTKLKLQKLEMDSQSVDAAVAGAGTYSFEITNMSESELKALHNPDAAEGEEGGENPEGDAPGNEPPEQGLLGDQPIQ
ncbi:PilN domain-containing protein [bacterium]|nr:PilN domain-containing protein [bacterium]